MQKSVTQEASVREQLSSLFFFTFSDKLKFAIKASLSMVLAYLIPLSQGWNQPQTAAITVMLIAAMGSLSSSIHIGAMRVVGTVIGGTFGMVLIALFPQDRMLYLLILSLCVTFVLYLLRAYKGDTTTLMLTAMNMMMVFKNGAVDNVFLYGVDKTYMTVFGIVVYTLVGVFLWPVKVEDKSQDAAKKLTKAQSTLFTHRDAEGKVRSDYLDTLMEEETTLLTESKNVNATNITPSQWHSLVHDYKAISAQLTLLALHDKEAYSENLALYVSNVATLEKEIVTLFEEVETIWESKKEIEIPETFEPDYQKEQIATLSHLERASLITTIADMKKLHEALRALALKLNSVHSLYPTHFDTTNIPKQTHFLWGDVEHLKGALVTFLIFWTATFFWIEMNPPGGFMVVTLATGLSVITAFTPIKPSMLIAVFSLSFVFASFMYIFVLPELRYGWELGLFLFVYSFIAFYWINPQISIFFLIGLFTFNIMNTMYYDVSIFLLILLMFYLYLFLLHIFYYVPFSTKPEYLFLRLKNRFFRLSYHLLKKGRQEQEGKHPLWAFFTAKYSDVHLLSTVKSMQLWANEIDEKYFTIDKERLLAFTKSCEQFAYLVELLYHRDLQMKNNPLLKQLRREYTLPYFSELLEEYAQGKNVEEVDAFWKEEANIIHTVEEVLSKVLNKINFADYTRQEIGEMYENISLRRHVWLTLFECHKHMKKLDFKSLEESRF